MGLKEYIQKESRKLIFKLSVKKFNDVYEVEKRGLYPHIDNFVIENASQQFIEKHFIDSFDFNHEEPYLSSQFDRQIYILGLLEGIDNKQQIQQIYTKIAKDNLHQHLKIRFENNTINILESLLRNENIQIAKLPEDIKIKGSKRMIRSFVPYSDHNLHYQFMDIIPLPNKMYKFVNLYGYSKQWEKEFNLFLKLYFSM